MASTPTYRVSTMVQPPYVMKRNGGGYEGFVVDLLDKIAEEVGFSYNMFESKDGRYGSRDRTGDWNGMIGEVFNKEADIAAGDLTITYTRQQVVDFTSPFMTNSRRLLIHKPMIPEGYLLRLGFLLEPFSAEVWFCIVLALVIVAILFMLIGRFNPYEWRQVPSDKDPRGARHSFGLRESLMFVFSTATLQGYRETPRSLSGRVLTIFWFIFIFLTIVAYIGNVTSFCLAGVGTPKLTLPFDSIDDLVQQRDIKVGVVQNGSTFSSLKNSRISVYNQLANFIESSGSAVRTVNEGIERVRDSPRRFVMLLESSSGDYITERDCSLMMYGPSLFPASLGFATSKGSPLRDSMNMAILKLREGGTVQMLRERWWKAGMCDTPEIAKRSERGHYAHIMGVRQMAAPFFILLIGVILSVIFLVGEVVFKKLRQ